MKFDCRELACGLAFGLLACSGSDTGGGASPAQDAGSTSDGGGTADAGAAQDSGGTSDSSPEAATAVKLVDTTPADGTLHVSVLAPVKLHFSGSLKASALSGTNVLLLAPNATVGIPATVAYDDATRTITLTPKIALSATSIYRVKASSLIAADSTPVADVAVSFTTLYNGILDEVSYNAGGTTIGALTTSVLAADGRPSRRATMAKGPDMMFETADDVPTAYSTYSYGAGTAHSVNYKGAGADAMWFTADDVISNYNDVDATVLGRPRSLYHSGPGADGMWQTADDVVGTFSETTMTPDGREAKAVVYSGAGPDNMPFTADDLISYQFTDAWSATTGQRIYYSAPGPDGMWNTADDVISGVNNYTLDALGRQTAILFVGKGPDGVYLTADDTTTQAWTDVYDPTTGLLTQFRILSGAGPDGVWLTTDDVVSYYYGYAHDSNGALVTRKSYDAGPDGIFFTADDVASYVEHYNASL